MNSDFTAWVSLWLSRLSHDMEIRLLPSRRQLWSRDVREISAFVVDALAAKDHVYFGILGRDGKDGSKGAIKEAHCLWADIDFKDLPEGQMEADGIVAMFDLSPSLQIHSGGGYHLYWFLDELTTDLDRVEKILKGLAPALKADIKAAEKARILRPPYTTNWKYSPPQTVKVVSLNLDATYSLDDFKEWELPDKQQGFVMVDENEERIDVKRYLKHYKTPIGKVTKVGDATLYCLKRCLFEEGHTTGQGNENEAAIGQQPDGKLFYQCFHQHCAEKTWLDVRAKISGNAPLAPFVARELRPLIERYVGKATGQFSIGALTSWLDIKTMQEREITTTVLEELEANRTIVRTGNKHGVYRPVDKNPRIMQLGGKKKDPLKVTLPLNLHTIVNLYPKNVILVAGEKDAGKTSFAMNTAYMNRDIMPIRYINSEMGEDELEARLALFPEQRISEWKKIMWIEQSSKFEDAIDPDALNIIDFLEIGADAYAVVEDIKRVFDRLHRGLLLIVMQKRSYKEFAVGGEGTLEKARLAINLTHGEKGNICKITVAKNWTGKLMHPKGCECEYKVWSGGKMEISSDWIDPYLMAAATGQPQQKKLNIVNKRDKDFVREG